MEDLPVLTGSAVAIMVVNGQPIVIQVDGDNAPMTAGNFVDLVERDFYDGISFHRVVRQPDPFVVQAGDPNSKDPNFPPGQLGSGGFIDPATGQERTIPLEIKPQGATEPIYSQTFEQAGITVPPLLQNTQGTIAMARTNDPDSASSQFFINLSDSDFLDGNYAVFGEVIQGFDVVDQIQQGDRIQDAEVVAGVIPGRESALIADPLLLNNFINSINLTHLPLEFFLFPQNLDADNQVTITPENAQQATSGILLGGGNDQATGSPVDDVINGNQGNDTITGEAGNDYIFGGQDNDLINGGDGNDILNGNRGEDVISGGNGDDFIRGGQGNDVLNGDAGNDYLIGDLGSDTMTGGAGADTFMLRLDESVGVRDFNAVDRITDFNAGEGDRIAIVGDISTSQLSFNIVRQDTYIFNRNGDFLGIVQNVLPDAVQNSVIVLSPNDLGLTIG
ncbi:peptidylprolyl isomerase [Limnoraphis robusta Tam1]|uniref:peptidylprolyl isomerase n=1 Tax=Limnoraphis robusta TaxID=1118279 RepID=UPI002B1F4CC2|nr:peptidylprolyl isomerase [Limnoraphis robusta]MEA5496634.1 peptidylprolyl isomerase [Limnoraphis robusta BA-68 BA1]MEA5541689.1 peptidylprolyl isomerase [Limnoraphis robusta Tam1]